MLKHTPMESVNLSLNGWNARRGRWRMVEQIKRSAGEALTTTIPIWLTLVIAVGVSGGTWLATGTINAHDIAGVQAQLGLYSARLDVVSSRVADAVQTASQIKDLTTQVSRLTEAVQNGPRSGDLADIQRNLSGIGGRFDAADIRLRTIEQAATGLAHDVQSLSGRIDMIDASSKARLGRP